MLRFETAGESHGECLVATLAGLPVGIPISLKAVNHELWRRQSSRLTASIDMGMPAGTPASVATRHSPWDSPAVSKRNIG